jgi:hypothetical protein
LVRIANPTVLVLNKKKIGPPFLRGRSDMGKRVFQMALLGALFGISTVAQPQTAATMSKAPKGVPGEYVGRWVCQSVAPGYNIRPPNADLSQPMTDKMTTPSTVVVIKFSLRADGSYQAPNAKGHYSFDPATKAITWLDGLHQKTFTKTQIGERPNGAPKIGFTMLKRYWGCFMPARDKT